MGTGFGKRQIRSMLNWAAGKTPADTDAGIWFVALWLGDPGADGQAGFEVSGAGYARFGTTAAAWAAATDASPSVLENAAGITFPAAGGDWAGGANVDYFALWNDATASAEVNYIGRGAIATPEPVLNGKTANFAAGTLRMQGIETT